MSTITLGSKVTDFGNFARYDVAGLNFFLSKTIKFLTKMESVDEIIGQICELPKIPATSRAQPKVEKMPCDLEIVADIMLVLDGSYSTKASGFHTIISFVEKIVESLIGNVQYGAIQYSGMDI
jgi:hypothetical protein